MTATTIAGIPRNKTGLFAADTLQEAKSIRNQSNAPSTSSNPSPHTASSKLLLLSSEQNDCQRQYRPSKSELQQYFHMDRNNSTRINVRNENWSVTGSVRNGFRPSTVRRRKLSATNSATHRDFKDSNTKLSFTSSATSAKLKSEIDLINSKLRLHGDLNKSVRSQYNRVYRFDLIHNRILKLQSKRS